MEPWGWGCRAGVWPGWGLRIMELGQRVRARLPGVLSEGQGAGARVRVRPLEVRSKGQGAGEAGEGQAPAGAVGGPGQRVTVGQVDGERRLLPLPTRPGRSLRVASHPILHPTPSLRWVARVEPESRP